MFFDHEEFKGGRACAALLFSLGLLQVAAYYLSAACVNGPGSLAVPQPDTLLYCQAARRICEGHAFSFSAGTAVSTGTTSVLYPFLLAGLSALGAVGGALLTAGFWLNAVFYLVFLFGWGRAFEIWLPRESRTYAVLLLALFPQTACCALAQSDTGLWMALSGLFVLGVASGRLWLQVLTLAVGPWVRPEGVIVLMAYLAASFFFRKRRALLLSVLPLLSVLGVLFLNQWLTGRFGFSSVANKGYFVNYPFAQAVVRTAGGCLQMLREVFLAQSADFPRIAYTVPVVGVAAFAVGLWRLDWRKCGADVGMLLAAALGAMAIVAQSGWQGSNTDRYLAWMTPLVVLVCAEGWMGLSEIVRRTNAVAASVVLAIPLVYSFLVSAVLVCSYHIGCDDTEQYYRFAKTMDQVLPSGASLGLQGFSGLAYALQSDRRVANLSGVYSPEFSAKESPSVLEILKREPETRFDYWLVAPDDPFPAGVYATQGGTILPGPFAYQVKAARWTAFDEGAKAPKAGQKRLVARVDVGYQKDETAANYVIVSSYGMPAFQPLIAVLPRQGAQAVDCGRLVIGQDEMDVAALTPGRDLDIVLRTADRAEARVVTGSRSVAKTEYSFAGDMRLDVLIDDAVAARCRVKVSTNGFSEVTLRVPGSRITRERHRVSLCGDHPAYGYWFYQ